MSLKKKKTKNIYNFMFYYLETSNWRKIEHIVLEEKVSQILRKVVNVFKFQNPSTLVKQMPLLLRSSHTALRSSKVSCL